jgi:hypothetical protein
LNVAVLPLAKMLNQICKRMLLKYLRLSLNIYYLTYPKLSKPILS